MTKSLAISALLLALAGGACTSASEEGDLQFDSNDGKADVARPYGTFHRTLAAGEDKEGWTSLTLREDKTYSATQELVTCDAAACADSLTGTYRFASSNGKRYVVLYDKDGDLAYSMQYKLSAGTLKLRYVNTDGWQTLSKLATVEIGDDDDGKSFDVQAGADVVVTLDANATTGYRWSVSSVDRTFGAPEIVYTPSGGATGSGGTTTLTWHTTGPLDLTCEHEVKLEYQRPWSETSPPAKTFSFTVDIAE
ncbi:hypothetical protein BH11MYX2_BH11MYX2_34230 [soil metagenome]